MAALQQHKRLSSEEPLAQAIRELRVNVVLYLEYFPGHVWPAAKATAQQRADWAMLTENKRRQRIRQRGKRIVAFAQADGVESELVQEFLRTWTTDRHQALMRELFAIRPPRIERALSRLRRFLALAAGRPERGPWEESAAELRRRFPVSVVNAALREYGERVSRFADESGLDASAVLHMVQEPRPSLLEGAFHQLEAMEQHLERMPHFQIAGCLQMALVAAGQLHGLARSGSDGSDAGMRRDSAEGVFHLLRECLNKLGEFPERREWSKLECYLYLCKLATRFERVVLRRHIWADLWLRLAPQLARNSQPDPAWAGTVRENLGRILEGEDWDQDRRVNPGSEGIRTLINEVREVEASRKKKKEPDGVYAPDYFIYEGKRQTLKRSRSLRSWQLLEAMWNRKRATFEELTGPNLVWEDSGSDSAYHAAASRLNADLPTDFPWRLRTSNRIFYKHFQENRNPVSDP